MRLTRRARGIGDASCSGISTIVAGSGYAVKVLLASDGPSKGRCIGHASATSTPAQSPFTHQRRSGPEPLIPETIEWVRKLPRELRPLHVVKYFPHVANRIYLVWVSPEHFERCMRDLMLDNRGGRQGFPLLSRQIWPISTNITRRLHFPR